MEWAFGLKKRERVTVFGGKRVEKNTKEGNRSMEKIRKAINEKGVPKKARNAPTQNGGKKHTGEGDKGHFLLPAMEKGEVSLHPGQKKDVTSPSDNDARGGSSNNRRGEDWGVTNQLGGEGRRNPWQKSNFNF